MDQATELSSKSHSYLTAPKPLTTTEKATALYRTKLRLKTQNSPSRLKSPQVNQQSNTREQVLKAGESKVKVLMQSASMLSKANDFTRVLLLKQQIDEQDKVLSLADKLANLVCLKLAELVNQSVTEGQNLSETETSKDVEWHEKLFKAFESLVKQESISNRISPGVRLCAETYSPLMKLLEIMLSKGGSQDTKTDYDQRQQLPASPIQEVSQQEGDRAKLCDAFVQTESAASPLEIDGLQTLKQTKSNAETQTEEVLFKSVTRPPDIQTFEKAQRPSEIASPQTVLLAEHDGIYKDQRKMTRPQMTSSIFVTNVDFGSGEAPELSEQAQLADKVNSKVSTEQPRIASSIKQADKNTSQSGRLSQQTGKAGPKHSRSKESNHHLQEHEPPQRNEPNASGHLGMQQHKPTRNMSVHFSATRNGLDAQSDIQVQSSRMNKVESQNIGGVAAELKEQIKSNPILQEKARQAHRSEMRLQFLMSEKAQAYEQKQMLTQIYSPIKEASAVIPERPRKSHAMPQNRRELVYTSSEQRRPRVKTNAMNAHTEFLVAQLKDVRSQKQKHHNEEGSRDVLSHSELQQSSAGFTTSGLHKNNFYRSQRSATGFSVPTGFRYKELNERFARLMKPSPDLDPNYYSSSQYQSSKLGKKSKSNVRMSQMLPKLKQNSRTNLSSAVQMFDETIQPSARSSKRSTH